MNDCISKQFLWVNLYEFFNSELCNKQIETKFKSRRIQVIKQTLLLTVVRQITNIPVLASNMSKNEINSADQQRSVRKNLVKINLRKNQLAQLLFNSCQQTKNASTHLEKQEKASLIFSQLRRDTYIHNTYTHTHQQSMTEDYEHYVYLNSNSRGQTQQRT